MNFNKNPNMPHNTSTILIVEDEPSLIFTLKDTLENEGFQTLIAENGQEALDIVEKTQPDLMILDVMLPGISGFDVCRKVREKSMIFPIIILTARDQEIDKVTGLNIGADDYITKPFGVKELLARIQARLRRSEMTSEKNPDIIKLEEVTIDLKEAVVHRPDGDANLTTREVEVLRFLSAQPGEPVTRRALLENVWRYEFSSNTSTRTVDVHISKLRSKVEMRPDDPKYLVTMHGVGYMLKSN